MSQSSSDGLNTISCTKSTVDRVRAQKRDGESDDELLRKMVAQYQPEATSASQREGEQRDAGSRDNTDSETSPGQDSSTANSGGSS